MKQIRGNGAKCTLVCVYGNGRTRDAVLLAGADQYIVYTEENYWEHLSGVDYIIDTLGKKEFAHELSVLKFSIDQTNAVFESNDSFSLSVVRK